MWTSWDDWSWDNYGEHYENVAEEELHHAAASADDDPAVKEALQADRVAEQLAAEAHRSWSEAQRATQALHMWMSVARVVARVLVGSAGDLIFLEIVLTVDTHPSARATLREKGSPTTWLTMRRWTTTSSARARARERKANKPIGLMLRFGRRARKVKGRTNPDLQ